MHIYHFFSLIIILNARVIESRPDKIGSPTQLIDAAPSGSSAAPPAAQPQQQQQQQQPLPVQPQQQASKTNQRHHPIYPIEGLSPYQNKWTIKARVTNKSDMKTYSNPKGDGKLFTVTLMDETAEIRGTAFNAVADDLYEKFQEGKVYFVSNARVNLAKKKFSNLPNDYELSFERNTEVEEVGLFPSMKRTLTVV
jgi:replication factor A1